MREIIAIFIEKWVDGEAVKYIFVHSLILSHQHHTCQPLIQSLNTCRPAGAKEWRASRTYRHVAPLGLNTNRCFLSPSVFGF